MGLRIPDEPETGNDCNVLKPDGSRLFPIGKTPRFVHLTLFDIEVCPGGICGTPDAPPNGRVYTLEQLPPANCEWGWTDGIESAGWRPNWNIPARSTCSVWRTPACYWFTSAVVGIPPATISFTNVAECWWGITSGEKGTATITWDAKIKEIVGSMHFQPFPGSLYEFFPVGLDEQVLKICNVVSKTNVKFKVNIADFY